MEKKVVRTDQAPEPVGPYSQAVIAGGFVFCSGQIALDTVKGALMAGDIRQETARVMENLGGVLDSAGCSFKNVVKTTIFNLLRLCSQFLHWHLSEAVPPEQWPVRAGHH